MNNTQVWPNLSARDWYGISIGGIVISWMICRFLLRLWLSIVRTMSAWMLTHLQYPNILHPGISRRSLNTSRLNALCFVSLLAANLVCICLRATTRHDFGLASGDLALYNLLALMLVGNADILCQFLAVSHDSIMRLHRWLGVIGCLEVVVHAIFLTMMSTAKLTMNRTQISGVTGGISLIVSLIVTIPCLRRHFYEIFSRLHFWCGIASVASLYIHTSPFQGPKWRYAILGTVILYCIVRFVDLGKNIVYNISPSRNQWLPRATVLSSYISEKQRPFNLQGARQIEVLLSPRFHAQPGQYVYLRFTGLGIRRLFETHPFWITSVALDTNTGMLKLSLIVKIRHGLTARMAFAEGQPQRTWVTGPYGLSLNLGRYGTVLMFATGIGITAHLSYIKAIIEGRAHSRVCTRRVVLVWEMEDLNHDKWVKNWLDDCMSKDTERLIHIRFHGPPCDSYVQTGGNGTSTVKIPTNYEETTGDHGIVKLSTYEVNYEDLFAQELSRNARGIVMVSVCTHRRLRQKLRNLSAEHAQDNVRYYEHQYQPGRRSRSWND